ncbi:SLAM family member 9-like isoform X2 [Rhinoderma darwinii]|uniref:SLAM family member 9-like isoform X2 n=1 Tax=Rhinoderma darwinii TaxID=43563 RepID=UPI003F679B58
MRLHLLTLILTLQSRVVCGESCRPENVSGAEGGEVILRVHQTGITFIYWILLPEGDVLATTEPGGSIDEKKVIKQYKGRVRSEADGSLHLRNLSPQDQKIYKADIRKEEDKICVQFNLTVYERLSSQDIKINHSITRNDTCSLGLSCTMDKRDVTVTWSNLNSSDINVTQGVLYIPPSGVNFTYICTARNPVSNVSETVIPGKYCQTDSEVAAASGRSYIACFVGLILVIFIIFPLYIMRNKRRRQKQEIATAYAEVGTTQTQGENSYCESQREIQEHKTVYSTVQHTKKKNSQKKSAGKQAKEIDSVYSKVNLPNNPKESQQNGKYVQSAGAGDQCNVTDDMKNSQKKSAGKEEKEIDSVYSKVNLPNNLKVFPLPSAVLHRSMDTNFL